MAQIMHCQSSCALHVPAAPKDLTDPPAVMLDEHKEWYAALELPLESDLPLAKKTYRRLVRTWHPDRFGDTEGAKVAQEKLKRITSAYKQISAFHRKNGCLPAQMRLATDAGRDRAENLPATAPPHVPVRGMSPARNVTSTETPGGSGSVAAPFRRIYLLAASAILLLVTVLTWESPLYTISQHEADNQPSAAPPAGLQSPPAPVHTAPKTSRQFTVGSLPGDVYEAQGVPTRTEPDIWYYGDAKVYFHNGRVIRWEQDPFAPLNAKSLALYSEDEGSFFTIGASASQVLEIQGLPTRRSASEWGYGTAKIYFRDGKVVGWSDMPPGTLKIPPR